MDTLTRLADATHIADVIGRERRALPSHAITGINIRRWAAAVCTAETDHRARDFARVEQHLGIGFDRWDHPAAEEIGQFDHEARAGIALTVLGHLISADEYVTKLVRTLRSQREAGWHRQAIATMGDLRAELHRRRRIWRQFLAAVAAYRVARAEFDAVQMRRAA